MTDDGKLEQEEKEAMTSVSRYLENLGTFIYNTDPLVRYVVEKEQTTDGSKLKYNGKDITIMKRALLYLRDEDLLLIHEQAPFTVNAPLTNQKNEKGKIEQTQRQPFSMDISKQIKGTDGEPLFLLEFIDNLDPKEQTAEDKEFIEKVHRSKKMYAVDPSTFIVYKLVVMDEEQKTFDFDNNTQVWAFPCLATFGRKQYAYYKVDTETPFAKYFHLSNENINFLTLTELIAFIGEYNGDLLSAEAREFIKEYFPFDKYALESTEKEKSEEKARKFYTSNKTSVLNDGLQNFMTNGEGLEFSTPHYLTLAKGGRKDAITGVKLKGDIRYSVKFERIDENGNGVEFTERLPYTDKESALVRAIYDLWKDAPTDRDGQKELIPLEIINNRLMGTADYLEEPRKEELLKMIKKLSTTYVTINLESANREGAVPKAKLEDTILNIRVLEADNGKGEKKTAIRILAKPVLAEFSEDTKGIIQMTTPTPKELGYRRSLDNIALRERLFRELNGIEKGRNNTIRLDFLASRLGYQYAIWDRTQKKRFRKQVEAILQDLCYTEPKFNNLKYTWNKYGNTITGIKIIID